jgi:type IV pilus biogenesis protein CpaD/CtpE
MKHYHIDPVRLVVLALAAALLAGCGGGSDPAPADTPADTYPRTASVALQVMNNDVLPTHFWVTGESISPSNRTDPGNARIWSLSRTWQSETDTQTITLYAGRNGQTLDTVSVTFTGHDAAMGAMVDAEWDGSSITIN